MAQRTGTIVTRPASFLTQPRAGPNGATVISTGSASMLASNLLSGDNGPIMFSTLRDVFGTLLGNVLPGKNIAQCNDMSTFMSCLDLYGAYKDRVVPLFGNFITAQLLNARNNFLTSVIAPIWETPEMNFSIQHKDILAMPFTEIAPCGIPEEPQGQYSYGWSQTVSKYAQSYTIERDLALDENFGLRCWLDILAQAVNNADLTVNAGVITTLVQIGYMNNTRNVTLDIPMDVHKLYLSESSGFLIAAMDPEACLNEIRNLEVTIPGLDTIITVQGTARYFANIAGETLSMVSQKISTDPVAQSVIVSFQEGPDSFKSIRLGNRVLNIIEFNPFMLSGREPIKINPMLTRSTIGQFFPPNPFINVDDCVKDPCSDLLDIWIWTQDKSGGREVRISMQERLKAAIYYDHRTGKVSRVARDFERYLNQTRTGMEDIPWDWNTRNPNYRHDGDINVEFTNYGCPEMSEVEGKTNLHDMPYREYPWGFVYVPSLKEYRIPKYIGGNHQSTLPNEWILRAARFLAAKAADKLGIPDVDVEFEKVRALVKAIRHSPWNDAYLFGLLDKNIPKLIESTGDGTFNLVPVTTPMPRTVKTNGKNPSEQYKYHSSARVEETRSNRFGGWDLPDRSGGITQDYPPGFDNGVGILTLAQEALNSNSLWSQAAKEAKDVVIFAKFLLKFLREYIGPTEVINSKLLPPWIHKEDALAQLLDKLARPAGAVFVGVPAAINSEVALPAQQPTRKVNIGNGTLLAEATLAEARTELQRLIDLGAAGRRVVSNEERAFACLSPDAYVKLRAVTISIDSLRGATTEVAQDVAELISALHQLYDIIIKICHYSEDTAMEAKNIQATSIIAEAFADLYQDLVTRRDALPASEQATFQRGTLIKELQGFITRMTGKNLNREYEKLKKDKLKALGPTVCPDYGLGFADLLRRFEKTPEGGLSVTRGIGRIQRVIPAAPNYNADYGERPSKYLRAPLASSHELREYLRDKEVPWILPADANLFYEYPEDPRIVTSNNQVNPNVHAKPSKYDLCSLSRGLQFKSQVHGNRGGSNKFGAFHQDSEDDESDNLFSSLKSRDTGRGNPLSTAAILSMGKSYRGDDDDYSAQLMKQSLRQPYIASSDNEEEALGHLLDSHYIGPFKARLRFRNKQIKQLSEKFFFTAIIEAKNRMEVPVNLAAAGAVIVDTIMVRPFVEVQTNAIIAMQSGSDTLITVISHSHVQVTKESRGCWHISVGFYMAILKIEPANIALLANAIPVSLCGGKNGLFMTNFADFALPNPTKPSIISFLVPPPERAFVSPLHLGNEETYIRPGIDYAIYNRKCSALEDWSRFVIGSQTLTNIDIRHASRATYATCVNVSNVLNQGPAAYIDPATGKKTDVEGVGPMGSFRMNMSGCEDVYEGRAVRFPDRLQRYAYQNS